MSDETTYFDQLYRDYGELGEGGDEGEIESDPGVDGKIKEIARRQAIEHSKLSAIRDGIQLGLALRQEVDDLRFDGLAFYTVLGLCLIKDFADILSLGLSGWITGPLVTVPLAIFFFMRKSAFKRWLIKRFLWRFVLMLFVESTPGASIFPAFTISCLLLKIKVEKERREKASDADAIEAEVSRAKKNLD